MNQPNQSESGPVQNWAFPYWICFIPSVLVMVGNLNGGILAGSNAFFSLVLLVIVDFCWKGSFGHFAAIPNISNANLLVASGFHIACFATLILGVNSNVLQGSSLVWASISTGLNAGLIGLTTAHEIIHRRQKIWKWLGILQLMMVGYGHFFIEHRKGHHVNVGTKNDPATARKGESFYFFLLRTIPGQWLSAFEIEKRRIVHRFGKHLWLKNFTLIISLFQITTLISVTYFGGFEVFKAIIIQACMAIFLLEYVNYIEHYGLLREEGEKPGIQHSWQSDSPASRFHLFELSRHSHHHVDAQVPYPDLQIFKEGRFLPFGYFGMFYIALIPPLWMHIMNPKLETPKTQYEGHETHN